MSVGSSPDGSVADGSIADGSIADASENRLAWVELQRTSGDVVRGERVASYDRRLWWDASDEDLFALFDDRRFAPFPDDRSLTFVSSTSVRVERVIEAPMGAVEYRRFLRSAGISVGRVPLDVPAYVITAHERYHLDENGYGDFAWDLVMTDGEGARYAGSGAENDDFFIFGAPVFAPVTARVIEVVRDAPDNKPGEYGEGAVNNLIGLSLGGHYDLYLLHFAVDSIPAEVVAGALVQEGDLLGRVGNSGVSLEPHLHITALYYDVQADPPRTYSVPSEFASIYTATSARGADLTRHDFIDPPSQVWISNRPF